MLVFFIIQFKMFYDFHEFIDPMGCLFFFVFFCCFFTNSVYFQLTSLSVSNLLFYLSVEFFFQKLCIL